jgi:hypothetical protein
LRLKVGRYCIEIIPENETDEAYIEEVLGLTNEIPEITARRCNVAGTSQLGHIEIRRDD